MTYDLLIRNARLIHSGLDQVGSIGILNGRIEAMGDLGDPSAVEVLDARGLACMSGVIDTQVHFREPGFEHKEDLESGTRSAIMGGVTAVLEMPNTLPPTTTSAALEDKLTRAAGRAWCDYGFFVGASKDNIDSLADLENLPGVPGVKIFVGSSTGTLLVEDESHLRQVLRNGRKRCPIHSEDEARNRERKALISSDPHPREHPYLRDEESARLSTERMLRLSRETGRPLHILHISTAVETAMLAQAKREGLGVTCEVTPQHLYFSAEAYERLGSHVQMNPPIRSADHTKALWAAVESGLFDVFGSDHAPHTLAEKAAPYPQSPSGMPGVQTMLPVLLTFASQGKLSLRSISLMACERPASLYGMIGKGRLDVGFDADLVLFDPDARYVFERDMVQSKCGWSPYEGEELTGRVEHVFLSGRWVVREGQLLGQPSGRMLRFA